MRSAVQALVEAVYLEGGQIPTYDKLGCGDGRGSWPIVADNLSPHHPAESGKGIYEFRPAVQSALQFDRIRARLPSGIPICYSALA